MDCQTDVDIIQTDMTIRSEWKSNKLLIISYSGHISGSDVIKNALELSADARFDSLRFVYSDWRKLTDLEIDIKDVEELVAFTEAFSKSNPSIMHAILMSDLETPQAFGGMYKFLVEHLPWKTELFHTPEDAQAWLENSGSYRLASEHGEIY